MERHRAPSRPNNRHVPDHAPFLIYGRQPVLEALRAGAVRRLWLAEGLRPAPVLDEIGHLAAERRVPIEEQPREAFDRATEGGNHQGVAAEATPPASVELEDLLGAARARAQAPLLLVLDHLEDPQNVGALLRSADAAGVHGVVLPRDRAVSVTPAVVRASAGAAFALAVAQVTNLTRALQALKREGVWVVGLDAAAPLRYDRADLRAPTALVVGSEGRGLSRLVAEHCDVLVHLPLAGSVASLNAATAGAIVLYEAVRQRAAP